MSSTDHPEYLPQKGWLSRQLAAVQQDVAEWPEWMRRESGRMEKTDMTLAEMRERLIWRGPEGHTVAEKVLARIEEKEVSRG